MELPRRKPLPASSPLLRNSYQPVSSPLYDESRSPSWLHTPKQHLTPNSSYGEAPRSWPAIDDGAQESISAMDKSLISHIHPPLEGKPWRTGYLRNVPWVGIGSLVFVLCSTLTSAVILIVSNGEPVSEWSVSPSVFLAVLSAISTALLSFALASGLNVSWWRRMIEGAPLSETHRYWDHGNSLWAALTAGRRFSLLSISKLLITLAAITEGPLIQKASTIVSREVSKTLPVQAALAVDLPAGYTADVTGEFRTPTTPSAAFAAVFNNYTSHVSITSGFSGCPGHCTANVPGVGFKLLCAPETNSTWNLSDYSGGVTKPQFTSSTIWRAQYDYTDNSTAAYEYLTLSAGWAINNATPLLFVNRVCNLSLAVVSYPIDILDNTITLTLPVGSDPEVLYDLPAAMTSPNFDLTGPTTLGGFDLIGNVNDFGLIPTQGPFYANVSMIANGALALFSLYGLNSFAWSHAVSSNWNVMQDGYVWRDPIPDIMAAYHEIMFRLGLSAAASATLVDPIVLGGTTYTSVKTIQATYTFSENYFVSRFEYLGGAMAVILLAICSILPTLRGWWQIGRRTTLSPLETAKAFGAPLLSNCNSNDTVNGLVDNVEQHMVKYGATGYENTLRIEKYTDVHIPMTETKFR